MIYEHFKSNTDKKIEGGLSSVGSWSEGAAKDSAEWSKGAGETVGKGAQKTFNDARNYNPFGEQHYCEKISNKESCLADNVCHYVGKKDNKDVCLKKSMYSTFMYGGMGYGSICMPNLLSDLLFLVIFPPFYVFKHQKSRNFDNIMQIVINFLLTCIFYFPGMIHALYIRYGKNPQCASLFVED